MEEKITFGKFIIKKRKEKNLTQKNLAEQLYVTESAVSKWERGISYPDISLVASLCEILGISEHELITASEDYHQRDIEKQARSFQNLVSVYSWIFYLAYGISLITCFIVNLAVDHKLSWFFIVLTAELVAFTLTSLPVLIQKHKALTTILAFFVSLMLLLLVCNIYTGGNWFPLTFSILVFAFTVVFLPFLLRGLRLPDPLRSHKTLICFAIDTILMFVMIFTSCTYAGVQPKFFTVACPIAGFSVLLPWLIMVTIRYIKINSLFQTSVCLALCGVYMYLTDGVVAYILDHGRFELPLFDFGRWTNNYASGNITLIFVALAFAFAVGGIILEVKRQQR